jgi:hypothetical protein
MAMENVQDEGTCIDVLVLHINIYVSWTSNPWRVSHTKQISSSWCSQPMVDSQCLIRFNHQMRLPWVAGFASTVDLDFITLAFWIWQSNSGTYFK